MTIQHYKQSLSSTVQDLDANTSKNIIPQKTLPCPLTAASTIKDSADARKVKEAGRRSAMRKKSDKGLVSKLADTKVELTLKDILNLFNDIEQTPHFARSALFSVRCTGVRGL